MNVAATEFFDRECEEGFTIEKFFHESDGLVSMEMHIPAGISVGKHVHNYSHLSVLAKGKVIVVVGDAEGVVVDAPHCLTVTANIPHEIHALTDAVWYCIHATDEKLIGI